ncbi:hypothetical protein FS749_012450, partial [Ceratobasidium sp. UAMH 11750]
MCGRSGDRERFEIHLHNLDKSIVQGDIRKYLRIGLKRANISSEDLENLTERSGALFIYAATVVRYIGAYNFSRSIDRLEQVLHTNTSSSGSDKELNALYALILREAFDDPNLDDREKDQMRLVLYTVICAQEPFSVRTMARILAFKREEFVHAALSPLRSVLDIQKVDEGITTLHKSFPDFMFDQARSGSFYCNAAKHHATLAERCLALINISSSRFNICHLGSSYVFDEDVADLGERVDRHISRELFYACRYLGTHLELAGGSLGLLDGLHSFLSERLLLWVEVMNLTQSLRPNGVHTLIQMKRNVKVRGAVAEPNVVLIRNQHQGYAAETRELAADAYDFVDAFSTSPASRSTPHVYVSALTFWDQLRPISKYYSTVIQSALQPMREVFPTSGPLMLPVYSLGSSVRCVAFSPDGAHIAAGSDDATIHVWNVLTGQTVGAPFKGHTGPIRSLAYSPDGKNIATSSTDGTIRIWDTHTGRMEELFKVRAGTVSSVVYLRDDALISGSADGTIRFESAGYSRFSTPLRKCLTGAVHSIALLPNKDGVVFGSSGGTIRTWVSRPRRTIANLFQSYNGAVYSVACSPEGARIISGSEHKTIQIWNVETGQATGNPLEGHTAAVYSVAYSPDGSLIISGSADHTIRIWDAVSGKTVVGPLAHHGPVHSVAFSPDGELIASGSADNTICIWDAKTGRMRKRLKWHARTSHSIAYLAETALSPSFANFDIQCSWNA